MIFKSEKALNFLLRMGKVVTMRDFPYKENQTVYIKDKERRIIGKGKVEKEYLKEKGFWIKEYELFPHTGCFLCPYQTKKAWLILKTHYPELFKIALKYHCDNLKLVGLPIMPNEIPFQKALGEFA